jgi:hypothetical protein
MAIRSLSELSVAVVGNKHLQDEIRADPVQAIQNLAAQAQIPDTWVYRLVIVILGATVLIVVLGGFIFAATVGKDIPAALIAIGSAAVGALAGLLAPSPVSKQ